jgi:hypothetical protein
VNPRCGLSTPFLTFADDTFLQATFLVVPSSIQRSGVFDAFAKDNEAAENVDSIEF